jgi:hypothetical protein
MAISVGDKRIPLGNGITNLADIYRTNRWLRVTSRTTEMGRRGYRVLESVLSIEECEQIRADTDVALHKRLPDASSDAYVVERRRQALAGDGYDPQVYQLMNYEKLAPWLAERLGPLIERVSVAELGIPLYATNYSVQVDWPDDETKRPYHTDGFGVNYKLFVYLTDVDSLENGPYTVIPGSHLDVFRKSGNLLRNVVLRRAPNPDDMHWGFSDSKSISFLGKAGLGIFSCQALAHKGWHDHVAKKRYLLVVYLSRTPATEASNLGREWKINEPLGNRD